jgi:predicted transcriptional regulator
MFSILCFLLTFETFVYGQKAKPLGGKNQQSIMETVSGSFHRGWIITDESGVKKMITTKGEKIDIPDNAVLYKIAELEKEYDKQQRDVRDEEEGKTSEYVGLLDWGKTRHLYEAVEKLAEKILKRNPANPDPKAKLADEWAKEQIKQMNATRQGGAAGDDEWTMEKVQKIRFALLGTSAYGHGNPGISFRNNVLNRYLTDMEKKGLYTSKEEKKEFLKLTPIEQARDIKKQTGFQYQPDINISRDPELIIDFRSRIQPLLARSCAQSNCHGGNKTKLQILSKATSIPLVYRNYYTLDTYRTAEGNLIDHVRPEINSLLINYLMPPDLAPGKLKHSQPIPNPAIRSTDDNRYVQLVDWLKIQPKDSIDVLLGEKTTTSQPAVRKTNIPTDIK